MSKNYAEQFGDVIEENEYYKIMKTPYGRKLIVVPKKCENCGATKGILVRHHVIPQKFRVIPRWADIYSGFNPKEIIILCNKCHQIVEKSVRYICIIDTNKLSERVIERISRILSSIKVKVIKK